MWPGLAGLGRDAREKGQGCGERREALNPARPPVCELHVHPDCVPFACSDCRQCHGDGHRDHVSAQGQTPWGGRRGRGVLGGWLSHRRRPPPQDTHHHHWREGNLPSGARCEVCRKTCGSSDVLAGVRCEWCGVQVGLCGGRGPWGRGRCGVQEGLWGGVS